MTNHTSHIMHHTLHIRKLTMSKSLLKKFQNRNMFSFQICFWNQFLTSGRGQTENTQILVFAYFQSDHFPKSKIYSGSRFKMTIFIFLFQIFFCRFFYQYYKKSKNLFPVIFSKSDLTRVGYIFWRNFFLKKPNFPKQA